MSKKSKTTATAQPLSDNKRKAIIITAIILVAAIILTVALTLILKPAQLTPADQNSSSSGTSSLTIRNGDFFYTNSDDTSYPKGAQNWLRKGYEAITGDPQKDTSYTHNFSDLSGTSQALMGIVTTATDGEGDTWATVADDLAVEGVTQVTNPGKPNEDADDDNVYMIAAREATAASILSDYFTVSSGKSVKITVWLNTEQVTSGNAVVMLQKQNTSAKKENWYAYEFNVENTEGWQELTFYIFNRDSSSKYIRVSVGLGNVYSGEEGLPLQGEGDEQQPINAEGILFIDDITYEEVTANDYRKVVDADDAKDSTAYKVIENEDIDEESEYLDWKVLEGKTAADVKTYQEADAFAQAAGEYSPFTDRDDFFKDDDTADEDPETETQRVPTGFKIFALSHNGAVPTDKLQPIGFRLNSGKGENGGIDTQYSLWQKDHHHISFWVRVDQINKLSKINIYVQSFNPDTNEWEDVKNGSWTAQVGSQEIDTDSNCGWVKYDVYIKPATVEHEISILITLGSKDGYDGGDYVPNGTLYVTTPTYENISAKDYNSASSGSYSKKIDLIGNSYSPDITNGSFSTTNNNGDQPSSWTPVFAGDNMLYRDGRGNEEITDLNRVQDAVEYGVIRNYTANHGHDDEQNNVLYIKNVKKSSFGYLSSTISLSAHTVYSFSFLVKGTPNFYILNNDTTAERSARVIASVTGAQNIDAAQQKAIGYDYTTKPLENGWTSCFVVLITGNESQTVRIALFNGALDGSVLTEAGTEVYYDNIDMTNLGTYAMTDDPDLEEGEEAEKYVVTWSLNSNYELNGEALTIKDLLTGAQLKNFVSWGAYSPEDDEEIGDAPADGALSGLVQSVPSETEWAEMLKVPEKSDENNDGDDTTATTEREPVDLGLLFSVISSVALVAALLVVIVVKIFKNKKTQKKAA